MFQRKLFRRALPVILSVAMVFQAAPATTLAAEGNNTEQTMELTTEGSSEPESALTGKSSEPESASSEESSASESASSEESSAPESASSEESSETESASSEEDSEESETESESELEGDADELFAEEDSFYMNLPDEIPFEIGGTDIFAGLNQSEFDLNATDVNASVYDPRVTAPETMTAVKNQNPYGTCWAFATTAIMENSMIRQKLANNSIDLSERHLAYFAYNAGSDRLENAADDSTTSSPNYAYLKAGGNAYMSAIRLMNWHGMAAESAYPYSNSDTLPELLSANDAQNMAAMAHDFYFIPTKTATVEEKKAAIKKLISEYGAVMWSYGHVFSDSYYNRDKAAYYYPYSGTNHAITVVGWNDTFSKDNFATQPEGDGAWIVKNSWDTGWGDDGYFYISYYDASLGSGNAAAVAVACDKNKYDNNYFYGNTASITSYFSSCYGAAQVFEVKAGADEEKLTAVSFMIHSDSTPYSIQIYKNPNRVNGVVTDPESGEKMLDTPQSGTTGYSGLYTVDLDVPVTFKKGDYVSVVIRFTDASFLYYDKNGAESGTMMDNNSYTVTHTNATHPGQSFCYNGSWTDTYSGGYNYRINALTTNVGGSGEETEQYTVTFLDADGNQIGQKQTVKKGEDAIPPTAPERKGYTFRDWSGSYKNITTDTILTAEYDLVEYTIHYELNGGTNADTNPTKYTIESDDITLAEPTQTGYIFQGWYEQSDFSGTAVTVIAKGSTGDRTLYAEWIEESEGVMKPVFIPSSGIVDETQTVTIKSSSGAKIYYTIDGTVPSAMNGTEYIEPFRISKDVTVKAIAAKNGEVSDVAETQYYFYIISLALSDTELTLTKGDTKSLTAVKLPTEREASDLIWSSSDENVAKVSDAGVVTALKKGTATITASTTDYMLREVSATCSVTVTNPKHTVIFKDADGNQIGEAQQVEEGENAIPPTAPQREGYTFKGWSGSYQNIMADTTLTAEYTPIEYTITYVLNGGTNAATNPTKYTIESETLILQEPSKDNSIFMGWYDNSSFSGNKITEIPHGSTGNLTLYAKWHEAKGLWMTDVADQIYTGKALKPDDFTVYDGLTRLTQGVDYTVSYKNNVNANTDGGDKAPSVIIKGKGNYTGTVTKTFKILPVDLAETSIDDIAVAYKNGGAQTPKPVVKWNGKKLSLNKDYELKPAQSYTSPGAYTVTVSGKGNFTGQKSFEFTIMNQDQKLISSVKKSKIPVQSYTGKAVTVTGAMLKLTDKTYTLAEGTDYTLEYGECINAGTYEVLIRGLGKYQGITRTNFRILGTDIKRTAAEWRTECTYDGKEQTPKPVITDKTTKKPLTEGQNYEIVSYSNNINAGTAKVTVRGIGAYSGTTTFSFKIKPASASAVTVVFTNGSKDQPYEKGGAKPKPIVTLSGMTLTEGTDYTLSYKNNTACPEKNGKKPAVVIKGKKNLTGSKEETFNIVRKEISEIGLLLLPDVEYNSKSGKFRTTPQLFDTNGKKLTAGTDYEKEIRYQSGGRELGNSDAPQAGETITVTITGKGAYDKTITGTYRIIDKSSNIAKAKVKANKTFYYTGEDIELTKDDLTVTLNNTQVKDYTIIPYPNNPMKGNAKFLLVGEGTCGGQKTITITIRPQDMKW